MLSKEEQELYSRHLLLDEIGIEGQLKLKNAKVLVIGAGGLGCPVLQYLCAAGVGTIGIADHDTVAKSNLQRQILFGVNSIGKSKAEEAKLRLNELNPLVTIRTYTDGVNVDNIESIMKNYDWIVDCTDNYETRYLINDASVILNKTLIYAAIYKFEGQVSVFNHENGPTYRCVYPETPKKASITSCSESGVLGVLPGMIGTLQANEVLKLIAGIGTPLSGKLLLFNGLNNQMNSFSISRSEHSIYDQIAANGFNSDEYQISCDTTDSVNISIEELMEGRGQFEQIVDVRELDELPDMSSISTHHIPLSVFESEMNQLDPTKKTIVFCQKGIRSQMAIELLQNEASFDALYNLNDGVALYQEHK